MADREPEAGLTPERLLAHMGQIIESSEDAIISKDLSGVILTWNSGAERIYGYTASEVTGRRMTLLLPEDRPNEELEILARIGRGERVNHFETVRRTKGGSLIAVSLTISPIADPDGVVRAASHVARDISERRKSDQQLQHFAAIVECSEDAIISKTLDGSILTWNAGAERVYGYPASEAIGHPMTILLPPDRPGEEAEILERIGRGERVEHFETVRRTKQGDPIDVSLSISPIRDGAGRVAGASHVARNITERRRMDQQLRHTQKLESLGVLAGGVAHDFNNLLTGIMGNTSLALEMTSPNHPVRGVLRDVMSASERASHLTRQLLAYAGKGQFIVEPINLSSLVREISSLIQTSIPKNVQLRLELREDIPAVEADAMQLQQVVMNLVINGAEAIGREANGTVLVTTTIQYVDDEYVLTTFGAPDIVAGQYISLQVHDTGCGMDEATISRIFDPFFTTKFTGRGLGLAAVQGIVRAHKGAMKIYSRPGAGTTFKILFPVTENFGPDEAHFSYPTVAGDQLVLVVDDEEVIRRTTKAMLEHAGFTVVVAGNGREGVELFRVLGDKVSLVLLDMTMPVMGGEEAFTRMHTIRPETKVILSSGYNEVEAVRRFTGKGIAGFVQKPFTMPILLEKIRAALS